ncbi:MAG: phosphoribulokinase [Betaproteobacteria bacterium]|nr:phosphoribulokinase [Betaproteobacteria bacterium]
MSLRHPIVAIVGSSGAGTTTVRKALERICQQENIHAAFVSGDSFHRLTRAEMQAAIADAEREGRRPPSHFGPEGNDLEALDAFFASYGASGRGKIRHYLHDRHDAKRHGGRVGGFTAWEKLPEGTDLLFYEGLHGAVKTGTLDISSHPDLLIGVVPTINLEWIQKIQRDSGIRGYSVEAVTDTILRRMYDYVHYIMPQFSRTHINFQRVPVVDTSNPFVARDIPGPKESLVVIHLAEPNPRVDFLHLLSMIQGSFMSRPNTLVIPGGKMRLVLRMIMTPLIEALVENGRKARADAST